MKKQLASIIDKTYYLSELTGKYVTVQGKKIGKLADFVINDGKTVATVQSIKIKRPFGDPTLLIPWEKVTNITNTIETDIDETEKFEKEPDENDILLKDYLLDKKVIDVKGREVEIVYDIKLVQRNGKLLVTGVDIGRYSFLRRIGFKWFADAINTLADRFKTKVISWSYVQPLPDLGLKSFSGNIKLNVLREKLEEMRPVDLADLLEVMEPQQRTRIFKKLSSKHASHTLEKIDPNVQRELISSLKKKKVANLIRLMTPGQAADVISALPTSEAQTILKTIKPNMAKKVRQIIDKQEEKTVNYATQQFIQTNPETRVKYIVRNYRKLAHNKKVIMYIYATDSEGKLLGVADFKELLSAKENDKLSDIMQKNVIALKEDSTLKDAHDLFERYDFRALPIQNNEGKIIGVTPYRDVMRLTHHFIE